MHVVWFKRDLRFRDHAPTRDASLAGPVLGLYIFEPELLATPEWDASHSDFIAEALEELAAQWRRHGSALITRVGEAVAVLHALRRETAFLHLWSHAETGNAVTYARDVRVAAWCREQGVAWTERRQDGVVRRLRSRDSWAARWEERMSGPPAHPEGLRAPVLIPPSHGIQNSTTLGLRGSAKDRQRGGERQAQRTLRTFLEDRGLDYTRAMSSPLTGADACSRLSPYLAWGCVSLREVNQAAERRHAELQALRATGAPVDRRWFQSLRSFGARLRWHCHFMQKLEDEPRIERENFSRVYDGLREDFTASAEGGRRLRAWKNGTTGYPFVDACLRCVQATGWLNFRMRALVMSFASYHLWLHWRETAPFVGRHFLDFEPGIHYSQAQMQSGTTGINTLRIYNPTKQALDQDPQGVFIRRWVPELARVPQAWLAEPHRMPPVVQESVGFVAGRHYPLPVVDHATAYRQAKEAMYAVRRTSEAREQARQVHVRHGSRKGSHSRPNREELTLRGLVAPRDDGQLSLDLT